ncbi:MAG TPA: hypothetical protein VGG13_04050 [Candidatus Saccharimonadales bacterium]|jgi:hypothetical protein
MEPTAPTVNPAPPQSQNSPQVQPQSDGSELNPLVVLQPGERVVCRIKRALVGLVVQYVVGGLIILLAVAMALFVVPQLKGQTDGSSASLVYAVLGVLVVIALLFLAVSSSIYRKNQWIVTSDSITQILQPSLVSRQVSQLTLDDLEDMTVQQNGILQSTFNFGTLRAETAGERSKFVFIYCPNPDHFARLILEAREEFMKGRAYVPKPEPNVTENIG